MNHNSYVNPIFFDAIALADLTGAFTAINVPLDQPAFYLSIKNVSNYAIVISYDGIAANDYIPANDTFNIDTDTMFNREKLTTPLWPVGTIVYAAVLDFPFLKPPVGVISVSGFTSFT